MSADRLISKIREKRCPVCVGLDTRPEYIPPVILAEVLRGVDLSNPAAAAAAYAEGAYRFNAAIIEAVCDIVPAVKVQCSHYDLYGPAGAEIMRRTLAFAREKGLYTIVDGRRNDVGLVAEAYAKSFFGKVEFGGVSFEPYPTDALTVTAYAGTEGIKPFLDYCDEHMLFVMTRSSAKSAHEIQELVAGDRSLYRVIASRIERWGANKMGEYGYSAVGAVVGATSPRALGELRATCRRTFLLVPGYGAQGGDGESVRHAFDRDGRGALVSASRSVLTAWMRRKDEDGEGFEKAAADAVIRMKKDILSYVTVL